MGVKVKLCLCTFRGGCCLWTTEAELSLGKPKAKVSDVQDLESWVTLQKMSIVD